MQKILIANRGEIAVRIMRTCQKMAIRTVAIYSEADQNAPFVALADEAFCIGKASAQDSYLNIEKIIQIARQTQTDAIHPGYGFLSENGDFAQRCKDEGIILIAPSPNVIKQMGSKIEAKNLMKQHQIPTILGYNGTEQSIEKLTTEAQKIGFPLLIKASAGGGGKGMKVVRTSQELVSAIESAKREAMQSFGNDKILLEKYYEEVRHIEFQILGDNFGNIVHLFERECSIQRRYQKIIEETPSPTLSEPLRQKMGETAVKIGQLIGYTNAGTVEFVVDKEDNFYFLEVNTRLQVEHPITECITGLDLVALQIEIAQGKPLPFKQDEIFRKGHAIELRLYAESPTKGFIPSTGKILKWQTPDFIRSDSGVETNTEVSSYYDPMLAKLIIEGKNRAEAIRKSLYALDEMICLGIETNQAFLKNIIQHPAFEQGAMSTDFLEKNQTLWKDLNPSVEETQRAVVAVSLLRWSKRRDEQKILPTFLSGWRNNSYSFQNESYFCQDEKIELSYCVKEKAFFEFQLAQNAPLSVQLIEIQNNEIRFSIEGIQYKYAWANNENEYFVKIASKQVIIRPLPRISEPAPPSFTGSYKAPMPGEIAKLWVVEGQRVEIGDALLVINSMKMENTIFAHSAGIVKEIFVKEKMNIKADKLLLRMEEEGLS